MSESARDVRIICPPPSPYDPSMLSIRGAPRRGAAVFYHRSGAGQTPGRLWGVRGLCCNRKRRDSKSRREVSGRLSRTVIVGDVHGCYNELTALVLSVGLGESDRLVAVGDLVTKGEKSREVLELFMNDARFSSVVGNHDRALLEYWKGERKS